MLQNLATCNKPIKCSSHENYNYRNNELVFSLSMYMSVPAQCVPTCMWLLPLLLDIIDHTHYNYRSTMYNVVGGAY